MVRTLEPRPIDLALSPLDAVRAWPASEPIAAFISGADHVGDRSRWCILARPGDWINVDGHRSIVPSVEPMPASVEPPRPEWPPFVGGWIGFLTYELGAALEPQAAGGDGSEDLRSASGSWPAGVLGGWARCDSALVHDNATGQWWSVGDADELPRIDELRERANMLAAGGAFAGTRKDFGAVGFEFQSTLQSEMGREAYQSAVARAVEYIRAGDVFQVNLAHTLAARMRGSPRALFAALVKTAAPWYGALLETPWGVIASFSPELFLDYEAGTRRVITRPMKGTRAGELAAAELLASEKDAAELNMIVDLMRNDLGRVCEYGSVRVDAPREIESHGAAHGAARPAGVLQGVATVSGIVRESHGLESLLRAAFPPGSITGAPKVRAMQIIHELERGVPRGPYCGCTGFVSDSGRAEFSVAIRTAVLTRDRVPGSGARVPGVVGDLASTTGAVTNSAVSAPLRESGLPEAVKPPGGEQGIGTTLLKVVSRRGAEDAEGRRCEQWDVRYGVGAGIVADSDPQAEWRETLIKARIWRGIADIIEE